MQAVWIIDYPADENLPPMQSEDGYQLIWTDPDGNRRGGFEGYIGTAPARSGVPTSLIIVDCSPSVGALMQADPRYELVEVLNG